eukprot:548998-Hanusia_phi.AAC.9
MYDAPLPLHCSCRRIVGETVTGQLSPLLKPQPAVCSVPPHRTVTVTRGGGPGRGAVNVTGRCAGGGTLSTGLPSLGLPGPGSPCQGATSTRAAATVKWPRLRDSVSNKRLHRREVAAAALAAWRPGPAGGPEARPPAAGRVRSQSKLTSSRRWMLEAGSLPLTIRG